MCYININASQMSQSIMQNGYAILMANDSDIDKYLLSNDYLVRQIKNSQAKKIMERDEAIATREEHIKKITDMIQTQKLPDATLSQYQEMVAQLRMQIEKLQVQSTSATFEDIRETHAVFFSTVFKPMVSVAYGYSQTRIPTLPTFGTTCKVQVPVNGDFFCDMILYFKISSFSATDSKNKVRYCNFPGHRLIREVRFVMDGNVLDRYNTEDINFFYDFSVGESQKNGWKRCVGQEIPKLATFLQDPKNQEVREQRYILNGYQTLKRTQDELEIFLPLQFWFCDPKFAMSNFNLAFQKTYIEIDLAPVGDIVFITDYAPDGGQFDPPTIIDFALYTNHIYTIPEVVELVSYRNSFNLVRVHRSHTNILNKAYDAVILDKLRFAVEYIMFNFRPFSNGSNENSPETWNNNNVITFSQIDHPSIVLISGVKTLAYTPLYYYKESPVVDMVGLVANGSTLYESSSTKFYDSYLPYRFGKNTVITPHTQGSYLMTFGLYPHKDQHSGYINLSNSKENYLTYSSSYIDPSHQVTLTISAKVINFLYLNKGSVSMRFST
jgi:hypothetical protein